MSAAAELELVRERIKAEARQQEGIYFGILERSNAIELAGVPTKTRRRRTNGGELDALEVLAPTELARLRDNGWMSDRAGGARSRSGYGGELVDDALERLAADNGGSSIDDGWSTWLTCTRIVDACRQVARGRRPGRWATDEHWPWWRYVAPACAADGVDVAGVLARCEDAQLERDELEAAGPVLELDAGDGVDDTGDADYLASLATLEGGDELEATAGRVVQLEAGRSSRPAPAASSRSSSSRPAGAPLEEYHAWLAAYLERLVHVPKRDYAEEYAAYLEGEAGAPDDGGHAWAGKVRDKLEHRYDAARARAREVA